MGVTEGIEAATEKVEEMQAYWKNRSDSYSELNIEEMNNWKREAWRQLILKHAPERERLRILDIGTGPGFFAINLALAGHDVTAVDVTAEMLACAEQNAEAYGASVTFVQQRGEFLSFEDETFDLIINRNVTWTLEYPEEALREWRRVLKKGGRMVYFDAWWYGYLFDEDLKRKMDEDYSLLREKYPIYYANMQKKHTFQHQWMEDIAKDLPLSRQRRPDWDRAVLKEMGMKMVCFEENLNSEIYSEEEEVRFRSFPMFMICAEK